MLLPAALFLSLALVQQTPQPPQPQASAGTPPAASEARTDAAAPDETPPTAAPAENVRVCRTEAVTGSRFGRQVCRNRVETADDRRDSQEMLRRMQGSRMPDGG